MDIAQSLYEIFKTHLKLTTNNYHGPLMPKEDAEAFLTALQQHTTAVYEQGKKAGQKEMLVGLGDLFNQLTKAKQEELGLKENEVAGVKSYFNWERGFNKC